MENEKNFNRIAYLRQIINEFINKPTLAKVELAYKQLYSPTEKNPIKLKILKDCKDIFSLSYVREAIADSRDKGLSYTELVSIVTIRFASLIFADDKRHYNMSALTSEKMISSTPTFDEYKTGFAIGPEDGLYDLEGNPMYIQCIGKLTYNTRASDEYIYKYSVHKEINGVATESQKVFSNIDLNRLLEEKDYYYAVVGEILSSNNIELSFADGYIGEHSGTEGSPLKIGEEYFDKDPHKDKVYGYTYRISRGSSIVYDGEKIEAIRAYNRDQAKKHAIKQEEPEH